MATDRAKKLGTIGNKREFLSRPGVGYDLVVSELGVFISLTRVRRTSDETHGLLSVRVTFRGAMTIDNTLLSSADFNCSSLQARNTRAKHLLERSRNEDIDWFGLLEELCLRVLQAEDVGEPEIPLEDVPLSTSADEDRYVGGFLPLLKRLPTIWFGDGGAAKSYLALYSAVDLAQCGERVLYLDWEFSEQEHRQRLHRLIGPVTGLARAYTADRAASGSLPEPQLKLWYRRCDRPLSKDTTRIKEMVGLHRITFVICDSIGFAADGAPESAEAATNYFRACRELGSIGSLHLAHVSKAEQGDQRPFGSIFWANGARNIWYLKRDEEIRDRDTAPVGFYHRKSNVGRLQRDFAVSLRFSETETHITRADIGEFAGLCDKLPTAVRMQQQLKSGPLSEGELAEALGLSAGAIRQQLTRKKDIFRRSTSGLIGLA